MIENVLLQAHKGLKKREVSGLGRLTVLCGPNDSGKTAFLEALCTESKRRFGRDAAQFADALAHKLAANAHPKPPPGNPRPKPTVVDPGLWLRAISDVREKRPIWHAGGQEALQDLISHGLVRRMQLDTSKVLEAINSFLPMKVSTILIPAKRRLETGSAQSLDATVKPTGDGVLAHLSWLKNQRHDSNDYSRYLSISQAFREITGGYEFDVTASAGPRVALNFSRNSKSWLPADDCGLGLQDVLLIVYFCTEDSTDLLAIEEPESHLHPEMQRRMLSYFAHGADKQIVLSTHSSIFLSGDARVFSTKHDGEQILLDETTNRARLLRDLGYSIADNLVLDVVVLVEGPTDRPVVQEFFKKLPRSQHAEIRAWPLGGDIMDQLDLSVIAESYKTFALVDGDPGSSRVRKRFIKKCEEHQVSVTCLKRYAIENYFTVAALRSVFPALVPNNVTELEHDKPVADQLGFSPKSGNGAIATAMAFDDIRDTDLGEFFLSVEAYLGERGQPSSA
jgi:hypothetical protein